MYLKLKWCKTERGACLLRVQASASEIVLPEQIDGTIITEIGDYCFAAKEPKVQGEVFESVLGVAEEVHEISGAYLTKICLPDTVEHIGNFAFYNCTKLEEISFGKKLEHIGSDAFMNCLRLHRLVVRCGATEKTGLKQVLAQLPWEIAVSMEQQEKEVACVLYPEYFETYDEISPAHIFGRNIQGEGFRARQCFADGIIDFASYDTIFQKVCAEENADVRIRLAVNRLRYPIDLKEQAKENYKTYLTTNADEEAVYFLRRREKDVLYFLCEQQYLSKQGIERLIRQAAELDWAEGAASLMRWKAEFWKENPKERYSFDDF